MDEDSQREERQRYQELLGELRTIIPGAQVLFAFLLTVPFAARFSEIDTLGKTIFMASLLAVAAATVLFLAPAAYHRLSDRRDRRRRLRFGVRMALVGLVLLGLSMSCAVFVVIRFVFGSSGIGAAVAGLPAALAVLTWFILPVLHRRRSGGPSEAASRR